MGERCFRAVVPLLMSLCLVGLSAPEVFAQHATIRTLVVDEEGEPMPNVDVEVQFKGTDGVPPKTIRSRTNRRGYFVRVGLDPGPYQLLFTKDGYQTQGIELHLSAGDLSETPDVVMTPRPPEAAAPAAPEGGAGPAPVDLSALEAGLKQAEAKKLMAAFHQAVEATRVGDLDTAERLYAGILEQAPNFGAAHYNLGHVYRLKQDWPAAVRTFEKSLELEPHVSDNYSALAMVHEAAGRSDQALEVLMQGAGRFERDAQFQFNLGIAYLNAGRAEEAEAALRRALEIRPANPEPQFYLATLALGRGEMPQAVELLEQYVAASGQNPQNLATAHELLKTLKP